MTALAAEGGEVNTEPPCCPLPAPPGHLLPPPAAPPLPRRRESLRAGPAGSRRGAGMPLERRRRGRRKARRNDWSRAAAVPRGSPGRRAQNRDGTISRRRRRRDPGGRVWWPPVVAGGAAAAPGPSGAGRNGRGPGPGPRSGAAATTLRPTSGPTSGPGPDGGSRRCHIAAIARCMNPCCLFFLNSKSDRFIYLFSAIPVRYQVLRCRHPVYLKYSRFVR